MKTLKGESIAQKCYPTYRKLLHIGIQVGELLNKVVILTSSRLSILHSCANVHVAYRLKTYRKISMRRP